MNPVIVGLLGIPVLLGLLVIGRLVQQAVKVGKARFLKSGRKNSLAQVVPLLDEPSACPTCDRLENVSVARSNFQQMPYVEHFVCRGCGTVFLGPNQEKMVEKRRAAKEKVEAILTGSAQNPKYPKPK